MSYFKALATDYDGTIAHDGTVDDDTFKALERLKLSGRRLIMVTGRELPDLKRAFPKLDLFDRIVAENGALLYTPATKEEHPLAPPPPDGFVERLRALEVDPLSVGRVIVATWEPNEATVLGAIREMGLDLQIIFNKGAVMVLPEGVTKASGLAAALEDLGLSAHNVVATGDAENDLAFMRVCGCAVAVGNALPAVKAAADVVTTASRGAGVAEVIGTWLDDEARLLDAAMERHCVPIGRRLDDDAEISLAPHRGSVLITGTSGGGKTTLATALLERLAGRGFELCIFDPEGDYGGFDAVTFGDADAPLSPEAALAAVRKLGTNVVLNLLGTGIDDRPAMLADVYPAVLDIRAKYGRPHWILIDEAHHMLPRGRDAGDGVNLDGQTPTIFITVQPDSLSTGALRSLGTVLLIGRSSRDLIEGLSRELGRSCPPLPPRGPDVGEAIWWDCRGDAPPALIAVGRPEGQVKRHTRKYAEGTLGEDRSFFFRGPAGALNIRAHNLSLFLQVGDGVDVETWLFHLRNGDFERWMRTSVKDDALADEVAAIAADERIPVAETRALVRSAVETRYTAPSSP